MYSTGKNETVDDVLALDLVLASGKVQSEGVHKNCTFQHCFLSFTYVILSFPLSFSSTCKCCVCPYGCFMYCIASDIIIQNTCRTEPVIVLFCFVESFSFLKINRILLSFVGSTFFFFYGALSNEVIFCDENPAMIRKIAGNQPNPSELCSSLCNFEQHLILFSFSTCSALWQAYQALIQQPMIFYLFLGRVLEALGAGY